MKTTETSSKYNHLELMPLADLLKNINDEDKTVPFAIEAQLPNIEALTALVVERMKAGGRLFYIGAGTSGRLGVVDASECPPTFGVAFDRVIGLIAGGDTAIRRAVEFAEDDTTQAIKDLDAYNVSTKDIVIGIAASGSTPYVVGGLKACQARGISTGCIVCNADSAVAAVANIAVEVVVGPEFVTGSTRMKSGTAQKLVLNMISTATMIQLGHIKGNKMVDMQLSNNKLIDRGIKMLMDSINIDKITATELINTHGNVRAAINFYTETQK